MMPHRIIKRRGPSGEAKCPRIIQENADGTAWRCAAPLRLHIGASPVPEYLELVTQTCLAGHVQRVQGVLQFVPESWADDGENDTDGTSYGL